MYIKKSTRKVNKLTHSYVDKRLKSIGMTYAQLAQHVFISAKTLKEWVKGDVEIPYKSAFQIYDILCIDPEDT